MLDGTDASEGTELLSVTRAPPLGAGPASVSVPVEGLPPITVVGFNRNVAIAGGGAGVAVNVVVLPVPL